MRPRPFQVQIDEATRGRLDTQAEDVGALTANVWAAMVLKTISTLPASTALKLMGKMQELRKDPKKRVSDL